MSEQDQNIEVVKKGYEAFMADDMETLMSLLDDNIERVHPGESAISGAYRGKDGLAQYERGQDADVLTRHDGKTVRAYLRAVSALIRHLPA